MYSDIITSVNNKSSLGPFEIIQIITLVIVACLIISLILYYPYIKRVKLATKSRKGRKRCASMVMMGERNSDEGLTDNDGHLAGDARGARRSHAPSSRLRLAEIVEDQGGLSGYQ